MCAPANKEQKGSAAELRTHVNRNHSKNLSFIVHSGDKNPHKHGHNAFADPKNEYDPKAEEVIKQAEAAKVIEQAEAAKVIKQAEAAKVIKQAEAAKVIKQAEAAAKRQ